MKNKIILHIPHSSTKLTKEFKSRKKNIGDKDIKDFNKTISDLYTYELFSGKRFKNLKAKYSRICCDVEKFSDDKKEEMVKYGMGVIYTHTNLKQKFLDKDKEYTEKILDKYYYPYHKELDDLIKTELDKNQNVILVDCHSFSKEIIMTDRISNLPDFCIGTYENNKSKIINLVVNYLENLGYKVALNYPYEGTMIPDYLFNKEVNNFNSVMIEVNKKLYLNKYKKNKKFKAIKKHLFGLLNLIEKSSLEE